MQELTYFNGEFVESGAKVISINDRGYLFGDSVYEVVRVTKGRLFCVVLSSRSFISIHA